MKTPLQLRQYLTLFNSKRIDNITNTFNTLFTDNNENDYINITQINNVLLLHKIKIILHHILYRLMISIIVFVNDFYIETH